MLANPAILRGGPLRRLGHDFETYCDIDLKKVGADAYSRHPSCEVLMLGYAVNGGEVQQWVPVEGEIMPAQLEDALLDPYVIKTCWNKDFEWAIWKNTLGITIPHNQWRDTQALSYSLALPGALEKAGEVVGLSDDQKKRSSGQALMRLFSKPRKPTKTKAHTRVHWYMEPAKWEEYKDYNRQDVIAERAILKKLHAFNMSEEEWELWVIDQIINERGIPMNMRAVDAAAKLYHHIIADRIGALREITGLANPNSNVQILGWLQKEGYQFDDLKKGHVQRAYDSVKEEIAEHHEMGTGQNALPGLRILRDALELRQDASRVSPKKYLAIQRCVDRANSVLRNTLQFAGAGRTWRWAGRIFQPQNLPRPEKAFKKIMAMVVEHLEKLDPEAIDLIYDDPMDLLVSCIRSVAQAPDGYLLYDADLNAIENRVLGWMSKCKKILNVFEEGRDPYVDFATHMYHLLYDHLYAEYKAGDDSKRQIAKPAVLGCGYQLGAGEQRINHKTGEIEATGLLGYARNMGIILTTEQAVHAVKTFRETFKEVVQFWYDIEAAAKRCVRTGEPTECNMFRFDIKAPFLRLHMPSGERALHYCRPRLEQVKTPWGEMRMQLTYEGLNDHNQWIRIPTHGGKLTENADQAFSRDLLGHGMKLGYARGLDMRLHVHDQLIGLAPIDQAEEQLRILQECMVTPPKWATHKGMTLPLGSNGFVSKIFMKD